VGAVVDTKKTIAVWFSCGAASAVAAKKTIEKYGDTHIIRVLNNPVLEEHEDNIRFKNDVAAWLGCEVETVSNPSYKHCSAEEIWEDRQYMSGVHGAPCTLLLKKEARRKWEMTNECDYHVLGFTYDEKPRFVKFLKERPNTLPVLIAQKITKADCFRIISEAGIELPEIYKLGYPNANCIGCVKATSPTYWNHVRKLHPDIFARREEQSREIGVKLVRYKGSRIFLNELPAHAKGRPMKDMNFECGIFCGGK
jgi:hypothetical protein